MRVMGRPLLQYTTEKATVTVDGNSIAYGQYTSTPVVTMLAARAPISGGLTAQNGAIPGQTILAMTANHAEIDASWRAGKTNVLIVWEIINNVVYGRTADQTLADFLAYFAAVRAVHPWRIVVVTGTPRFQDTTLLGPWNVQQCNDHIAAVNAGLRANWRSMGIDSLADVMQPGSPFAVADYTNGALWDTTYYSTADGSDSLGSHRVHWTDAGFAWAMDNAICPALARVRR